MKLFLDDIRNPDWVYPDYDEFHGGWTVVRSSEEAIRLIDSGKVTHISFDNDMGMIPGTTSLQMEGWEICKHMVNQIMYGEIPRPEFIHIHSANIIATERMYNFLKDLDR